MKLLFPSVVIRRRTSDRGPHPEAIRSWRWVFLSAMLLAAATFGALYVVAVQAQASTVSFCNGNSNTDSYGFSVNENAGENTGVGTLAACGDPHRAGLTYSVGGTDAAAFNEVFALETNKGEIAVKLGASIDYESKRSYSLTATVADAVDSTEVTIPMSITVLNVDDPGTIRLSTTDPWVGRQVSFSLSDPDSNPRIYRIEWSRAYDRRSEFVRFLPVYSESDSTLAISDLTQEIYTPTTEDRWKLLKVTAYYVDDECIDIDSYTNRCRKNAEAVFADMVADEEGLRIARQMANSPATGRVVISAGGRRNAAEISPKIHNSLTVNVNNLRDADGVPFYNPKTYRWFRVDPETLAEEEVLDPITIPGLKDSYVPKKADFGKSLKVQVSFYDLNGSPETLTSPLTAPVLRGYMYAATGSPVITGTVQVGETLSVDTSGISDRNGIDYSALTHQWIANDGTEDTDIQDATGSTYILAAADEGKTIKVRVSYTDESLYEESLTSTPTATVASRQTSSQRSQQQNSVAPTIKGSPALSDAGSDGEWTPGETVNVTLTFSEEVNVDTTDGRPSVGIQLGGTLDHSASYTSGSGKTKLVFSYTLADDDGSHSSMFVPGDSLTLNGGTITSASSGDDAALEHVGAARAAFAVVVIPNSAATGTPTISGTAQVGQMLNASTSDISDSDGLANANFTYQWIANDGTEDTDIQDATGSTYTVGADDEGKTIKVRVSFTDDGGNQETRTSDATVAVAPIPNSAATGAPTISGTAQVGQMLAASTSAISDGDGLANAIFTYQWLADDTDITDATGSTYTLASADEGKTIKVRVSFTDDAGNDESLTSEATAAVAARPNSTATGAPTISGTAQVGQMLTASTSNISDSDGLADAIFTYQWIANDGTEDTDIQDATGSTYTLAAADEGKTIKVRLSFTDDAGNDESLTSAATVAVASAPTPLTAAIHDAPESHDGEKKFTFQLRFSEDLKEDFSYKTLRDHAFSVKKGTVVGARRLAGDSDTRNIKWEISVTPDSNADVTVELPITTDCEAQGAICTADGTVLSSPLKFTVKGPPLTASFESVPTSHNGSDSFRIRIALSEEPKSGFSYTTMRDHAFTVTGGSVTGARRLVTGSNIRWEVTVEPDSSGDVTITLPATTDCDAQGAICADGDRKLSEGLERTVSGPGQ